MTVDYQVRQNISRHLIKEYKSFIQEYCAKHKYDINYLYLYPLNYIEETYHSISDNILKKNLNIGYFLYAHGDSTRDALTWFFQEVFLFVKTPSQCKLSDFNNGEYQEFKKSAYPKIYKFYKYMNKSKEVLDNHTINKTKVIEKDNSYIIKCSNSFQNASSPFLYFQSNEMEIKHVEQINDQAQAIMLKNIEFQREYKGNNNWINILKEFNTNVNTKILNLFVEKVNIDTEKLGSKLKSKIISNKNILNNVLGYLYYLSYINGQIFSLENEINKNNSYQIISMNKESIIKNITNIFNIDYNAVKKIIDYLIFDGSTQLLNTPLLEYNDNVCFIPSLIMLNDWQFTLVDGHYDKGISFERRDKTISPNVVDSIYEKAKGFKNLTVIKEKTFKYINKNGEKIDGEIDVGIYDFLTNSMLIIECKWKDNHYDANKVNYVKVESTLNSIFKKQLSKSKELLECNKYNDYVQNKIFNTDIRFNDDVIFSYVAVDKRNELHIEDKHMLGLYTILDLLDSYNVNKTGLCNLLGIIQFINSQETKTYYSNSMEISKDFKHIKIL